MQADYLSSEPPGKPQFAKVSSIQGLLDLHKKPLVGRKVMLFPHLTDEESEMRLRGEERGLSPQGVHQTMMRGPIPLGLSLQGASMNH